MGDKGYGFVDTSKLASVSEWLMDHPDAFTDGTASILADAIDQTVKVWEEAEEQIRILEAKEEDELSGKIATYVGPEQFPGLDKYGGFKYGERIYLFDPIDDARPGWKHAVNPEGLTGLVEIRHIEIDKTQSI